MTTIEARKLILKLKKMRQNTSENSVAVERALLRVGMFLESQIKLNISNWKARGYLWQSGALINSIGYRTKKKSVSVYSAGVPYARVHEFGTVGKGGKLPDIRPKPPRRFLTIPLDKEYRRVKPRTLDLEFVTDSKNRHWLWDLRKERLAYRLVRMVSIPARPYFFPALKNNQAKILEIIRIALALKE